MNEWKERERECVRGKKKPRSVEPTVSSFFSLFIPTFTPPSTLHPPTRCSSKASFGDDLLPWKLNSAAPCQHRLPACLPAAPALDPCQVAWEPAIQRCPFNAHLPVPERWPPRQPDSAALPARPWQLSPKSVGFLWKTVEWDGCNDSKREREREKETVDEVYICICMFVHNENYADKQICLCVNPKLVYMSTSMFIYGLCISKSA